MTHALTQAEVTLPSDSEVLVKREFDAPIDLVYKALTTPSLLQRWMLGPPGWSLPVCEMDLRVGGKYRYRWRSDEDGKEFGFHGEFIEVVPPRRLVHTEVYDPGEVGGSMGDGALITMDLEENGARTILATRMDYRTKEARDMALSTGMTDGMEMTYARLDEILGDL